MNNDIIIPYCIWHYIDIDTNTFLGYISGPRKYRKDGVINFDCGREEKKYEKWVFAGTFYAVSPSFRPIPVGMKIFCAKKNLQFPYDTDDVYLMYDPYNIKDDCVYFTTYIQPVPNTSPLYFHMAGEDVFPSFDPNPPSNSPIWTHTRISPIYVMTSKHDKFKCVNGRCIPWTSEIPSMYDSEQHKELLPLQNCVIYCNELVPSKNEGKSFNILEMVASESLSEKKKLYSLKNIASKFPSHSFQHVLIVLLFFITLIILIIVFVKRLK